jgi:hypothetical protein
MPEDTVAGIRSSNPYFDIEGVVSNSFNRLKGKFYNLIEASVNDPTQREALKGLIKGFSNEEYRNCKSDMQWIAREKGLIPEGYGSTEGAEPLEQINA